MRKLLRRLWADDCGALILTEWVFVTTLLMLGAVTGLVAVRQAVRSELPAPGSAAPALTCSYGPGAAEQVPGDYRFSPR